MGKAENYVAVLPDGAEYFGECGDHWERSQLASEAVRESGLKCSRKNPQDVPVTVFRLGIVKGNIVRHQIETVKVSMPLEPMTEAEFESAIAESLNGIPPEFRGAVHQVAWDDGHAHGYEEVLSHADTMIDWLAPVIAAYTKRITAKKK